MQARAAHLELFFLLSLAFSLPSATSIAAPASPASSASAPGVLPSLFRLFKVCCCCSDRHLLLQRMARSAGVHPSKPKPCGA